MDKKEYKGPSPTVDIIIMTKPNSIVLIERKNPPFGWALPGGFIDYGESAETAAFREAKEETSLDIDSLCLAGVYSEPDRDPRQHVLSVVFAAKAVGQIPFAADDAKAVKIINIDAINYDELAFDHAKIIKDFFSKE